MLSKHSMVAILWIATAALADDRIQKSRETTEVERQDALSYTLGPHDQINIVVPDAEDISSRTYRIDTGGSVMLPLVGRVRAAGLTVRELETEIVSKLSAYMRSPEALVTVSEFRSQPVSVIGAVNSPGVHQLLGSKRLVEVLSLAGGLRPDAGRTCRITRTSQWGEEEGGDRFERTPDGSWVTEIDLQTLLSAQKPEDNLLVRPHDVISVPRADMIYVVGDVNRPGGFLLNDREPLSVLQALALAGGLSPVAAPKKARILRSTSPSSQRDEVPVNISQIMDGKSPDVKLTPQDILFIPNNTSRRVAVRAAEAAVQALTGIVVWRGAR